MMDVYQNNVTGHVVSVDPTGRPWPMGGVWPSPTTAVSTEPRQPQENPMKVPPNE